jgi:8-oxo-dGTP pyrophosphatase MutT (NUDIX family)
MPDNVPLAREAGRVLLLDSGGRVLLLQGFDPARPGRLYWFTVGGGTDPGESLAQAAARELREETGVVAGPAELGAPVWHRVTEFTFAGLLIRQREEYFVLRAAGPAITLDGLEPAERDTVTGYRWWSAAELDAAAADPAAEPFFPAELPGLLRALAVDGLAGDEAAELG